MVQVVGRGVILSFLDLGADVLKQSEDQQITMNKLQQSGEAERVAGRKEVSSACNKSKPRKIKGRAYNLPTLERSRSVKPGILLHEPQPIPSAPVFCIWISSSSTPRSIIDVSLATHYSLRRLRITHFQPPCDLYVAS